MTVTIIILLLIIAIGLILIEIFLVPGVGIPGIAGTLLLLITLVLSYQIDRTTGHYTLVATCISSAFLIWLTFRSKTWDRLSQKAEITAKVQSNTDHLNVGDQGLTLSRLSPAGTARFGEYDAEVNSREEFIDAQTRVEIITIEGNKIFVKSI